MKAKISVSSEFSYFVAIFILSFSVSMIATTGFGVSMIVAPAFILSKLIGLTFGQSEYIIQAILFVIMCIILRKFKIVFLSSFITGLIYGAVLDTWRLVIPHFNPEITPEGSLPIALRIAYLIVGMVLTSLSIAIFFKTYLYPQVYDFFVKAVSGHYNKSRPVFKTCFDATFLVISVIMSLSFFKGFVGIGIGTVIMTCCNGFLIGKFSKILDKYFDFKPTLKNFSKKFEIN